MIINFFEHFPPRVCFLILFCICCKFTQTFQHFFIAPGRVPHVYANRNQRHRDIYILVNQSCYINLMIIFSQDNNLFIAADVFFAKLRNLLFVNIQMLRILSQSPVAIGVNRPFNMEIQDNHRLLFFQPDPAFQIGLFYQRILKFVEKRIRNVILKLMLSQFKAGKRY